MDLKIVSDDGTVLRLAMSGKIVRGSHIPDLAPFDEILGTEGYRRRVVLSMADTTFIDSSCLSWLVVAHKRFSKAGGRLVFHSIRPYVMEILSTVRFDLVLHLADDEAAALDIVGNDSIPPQP